MQSGEYTFVRARVEDRGRILTFMRQHFYKHEPLSESLGMVEGPSCPDMIFSLATLHEGTSLMAFEATDAEQTEIVGVSLNGEAKRRREEEPVEDIVSKCPCPKYAKLLKFLCQIDEGGYVWKSTEVDKVLDIHVLAVDTSKRRGGLGQKLVEQAESLAKEEGYPAVTLYCTSQYSASLAEKLGYRLVLMLKYDEYLDQDGRPVFNPPPPHVALKCYVHVLDLTT